MNCKTDEKLIDPPGTAVTGPDPTCVSFGASVGLNPTYGSFGASSRSTSRTGE